MSRKTVLNKNRISSSYLVISGLGLVFCFGAATAPAQQNQSDEVTATPMQQDQRDPQGQGAPDQGMQQAPPEQAVPQSLTLPAGTVVRVRVNEWLSSDRNVTGDGFSAVLDQPIVVDGWVVARRGQSESGRVSEAKKAGRVSGTSELGLELTDLTLVDGQQLLVQTQLLQSSAGTSHGQDAATIGSTTGVGAVIGAVADGGRGAAIGAGAGAAAGIIGVLATRGKPTIIFPETVLTFRLQAPVNISTEKSQFAFQPVTQGDYDSRSPNNNNRPQRLAGPGRPGYPPPPPYSYYGYPYAYSYPYSYPYAYYPAPFAFGFYGGYGFGARFGGFRGGFRR
jgi:hypothetical protein